MIWLVGLALHIVSGISEPGVRFARGLLIAILVAESPTYIVNIWTPKGGKGFSIRGELAMKGRNSIQPIKCKEFWNKAKNDCRKKRIGQKWEIF